MRPLRAVGVLTLATLAIDGCGSDPSTESTSAPRGAQSASATAAPDPCALVTKDEADMALGAESTPDRPSEANIPPGLVTCRYTAPRGQGLAVMTVMVRTGYSDAEAKTTFQGTRDLGQSTPVANLGDDAFWFMDQLYVLKGRRSITVTGDAERSVLEELARTALDRLR